jgi:hypothetical protein
MIIFWILLGLVCYIGPIILMFYAYSLELKDKRTIVTIGDVWSWVDEEIAALTFTPAIGLFMCFYYIFKIVFYKIKNIQI